MTDDLERREYWKRRARKAEATIERQRQALEQIAEYRFQPFSEIARAALSELEATVEVEKL